MASKTELAKAYVEIIPWQPGGMTVNLNNEFHTHDSLSESELTREAESMAQRLKWAIP